MVDRDQVEASLREQAHHDPLTGLPNRTLLTIRLAEALHRSCAAGCATLVVCDLDEFGLVNDSLGHHAGDEVLVEVGRRLREVVRPCDLVCRLDGDEFAVLLTHADEATAGALTRRLLTLIPEPLLLHTGHHVDVRLSVGIASATSGHDGPALLRDADAALHRAKKLGRGRAERFDDELRVEVTERLALRQDLRDGIGRDELFCLHQPELDLTTGELFGFEALVRWQHPDRGLLLPDRFVPLAEDAGLAGPLFDHVLANTLGAQHRWATNLGFRPTVSVNLSPRQLDDPTLPGAVAKALTRAHAPADTLWLEVTETALAEAGSLDILRELHELGVHIAIDDFGTGWSSLARLSAFPWDVLKIDRGFVATLEPGSQSEHLVRAIIMMAHALGIRTIAEGVETHQQLELLSAMHCDIAQGYLFGRPLEAAGAIRDVTPDGRWHGPGRFHPRGRRSTGVPVRPA